jgi:hypothetical protein
MPHDSMDRILERAELRAEWLAGCTKPTRRAGSAGTC